MRAMLASAAARPPTGAAWSHEVKWDGMRILADVRAGRLRLTTRAETEATDRFPELAGLLDVHPDVLLDGEVVSLEQGQPSFSRLIDRIHARGGTAKQLAAARPVTYMVFDLLRLDGHDVTRLPLRDRRALLEGLEIPGPRALVPPVYPDGAALLRATAEQGLEGIVSKRLDSQYEPGRRSPSWVKIAHRPTQSVIVGGWRPEATSGAGLGALLVGIPQGQGWRFVGRVGSGLGAAQAQVLLPLLAQAHAEQSPFTTPVPPADARGTHWVAPRIVVDVRSLGTLGESTGRLRQPTLLRVRADLSAGDLREAEDG
ncbi:bifunctional non-homologous end joining protein LigD [Kineosphaera limosa]|uniref:DNA ligase (ATP) n=2 Tax=Kineosphaera TaxID=211469 RepID=K6WFC2_9MICO|nr:bifunctional non-homologous end joining protein LigD [Kineosphaera limosa]GAB97995.1 putative ATP-dependent DNA ligase [Kineosphaera limosa NBRC 100340]